MAVLLAALSARGDFIYFDEQVQFVGGSHSNNINGQHAYFPLSPEISSGTHLFTFDWQLGDSETYLYPFDFTITVNGPVSPGGSAPATEINIGVMYMQYTAGGTNLLPVSIDTLYHTSILIDLDSNTATYQTVGLGDLQQESLPTDATISVFSFHGVRPTTISHISWEVVPEPSTILLIAVGMLVAGLKQLGPNHGVVRTGDPRPVRQSAHP